MAEFRTSANLKLLYFLCVLFFFFGSAGAEIKSWTDENGVIHFQNTRSHRIEVEDYRADLPAIQATLKDLGLPQMQPTLLVYARDHEFQHALASEFGLDAAMAEEIATFATGYVFGPKILINERRLLEKTRPERIKFLAHEVAHVSIDATLGPRRDSIREQWLLEGLAEWIAYRVLERVGMIVEARRLFRAPRGEGVPALAEMASFTDWVRWRKQLGPEATYGRAFHATDLLIQREGLKAVIDRLATVASGVQ